MLKTRNEEELCLFAGITQRVWFRRNEIVHGVSFTHLNVLVQQARNALVDFSIANVQKVANEGSGVCST
jgi:tRNA A-37 threonylcarbamoyl transferase component Bud32